MFRKITIVKSIFWKVCKMNDYNDIFRLDDAPSYIWGDSEAHKHYDECEKEIISIILKYNLSLSQTASLFKGVVTTLGKTSINDLKDL